MTKKILYLGLDPSHFRGEGEMTHFPVIEIVPRPLTDPSVNSALLNFHAYTHVLVTSKTTVAILKKYLPLLGIGLDAWVNKSTIAVGKVTARHLTEAGVEPFAIAEEERGEGIIDVLQKLPLDHAYIFWPHSSQARPLIADFLEEQAIPHTACTLYDPKPNNSQSLPRLDHFDEIVFTSPSTVQAFLEIFGRFPSQCRLIPIGPVTENYLEKQKKNLFKALVLADNV